MARSRAVHGAILRVENGEGDLAWTGAAGNLRPDQPYFIASVTKMYATVVVLRLRDERRLGLDDPIHRHPPADLIRGLHVRNGVDRTDQITIKHLISNTSGLTDDVFGKGPDGRKASDALLARQDEAWPLERIVERVRTLSPRFPPGQPGKVRYSDTNDELLGRIIETVTGKPIAEAVQECIFDELDLRYIASVTAEGGIVSTSADTMRFVEAFFTARFFPPETVETLKEWNRIHFPGQVDFGIGLEKQQRRDRAALAFRLIGRTAAASSESTRTPRRASSSWGAAPA